MEIRKFKICERWMAAAVFVASLAVYLLTLERGASFWDCPEYIAQAAGMEVGHPPGNPTWLLAARMAAILAPDAQSIAIFVNATSALFTALAAMLLMLTGCWFARRLLCRQGEEMTAARGIASLTAGVVGALCFAFCDTAWFSAVEAEVYAFSIFITALMLWLTTLWADCPDSAGRARYLILLAYITGLSIGVHQLNLLCIPALGLLMLFSRRREGFSAWKSLLVLILCIAVIALILFGLMPGTLELAKYFELFAVNGLTLPYHTGVIAYLCVDLLLLSLSIFALRQGWRPAVAAPILGLALFISGIFCLGGKIWLGGVLSVLAASAYLLYSKRIRYRMYLSVLSISMLTLGFSVYGIIMIRAHANPPMNEGNPDNIFTFASYLGRDQYGSRPLLHGRTPQSRLLKHEVITFDSAGRPHADYPDVERVPKGRKYAAFTPNGRLLHRSRLMTARDSLFNKKALQQADNQHDAYVMTDHSYDYRYPPELDMWLPRIVSNKASHIEAYDSWVGMNNETMLPVKASFAVDSAGRAVGRLDNMTGERTMSDAKRPTYLQNAEVLFSYQIGYMYLRYLMWNFSGRQNDVPSQGQVEAGNFITGIAPLDRLMLGDDLLHPEQPGAGAESRNVYFMIPLLLGILGIIRQLREGREGGRQFAVVGLLFLLTGLAIVVYLNQTPGEARERDYSFVGSFYAFAIWIGIGAGWLVEVASRPFAKRHRALTAPLVVSCVLLAVPIYMCVENYPDHDRSRRSSASDFGRNILVSLEPDAILLENGDNFTFPLWYAQETELFRTDVRTVNLAYLSTPWYVRQLYIPARDGKPLPLTAPAGLTAYDAFQTVLIPGDGSEADGLQALKKLYGSPLNGRTPRLSAQILRIPKNNGDSIRLDLRKAAGTHYLNHAKLMLLDLLVTNANSTTPRPVYWTSSLPESHKLGFGRYGDFQGLVVRLTDSIADNHCNSPMLTADNMLTNFRFGGISSGAWPDEPSYQYIRLMRRSARIAAAALLDSADAHPADPRFAATALSLIEMHNDSLPTTFAPYGNFADRYLQINEAAETARIMHRLSQHLNRPDLHEDALELLRAEIRDLARWKIYFDDLPPRLRGVVSGTIRTRIAGFYAPIDEYLTLGGDPEWLRKEPLLKRYDLKKNERNWRRNKALQLMLREARYPTSDTLLPHLRREYLDLGGDPATLDKYAELRGKFTSSDE